MCVLERLLCLLDLEHLDNLSAQLHALLTEQIRASLKQVAVKAALLVDGADDGGGHVEADPVIEGLGEEALGLDIGQPGAAGLGLGEGDVVTELDLLACFLFESE